MIPTQIGPYEIQEKIGSGGMGSVYLGKHRESGQQVAVKILPASLAHEEGFVERFAREIDSMKRLSNPHVVQLYDSGVDNGTYYYSMEYVPGETLTQKIRREKRLAWHATIEISLQICSALKAAHDTGIIHRDLKPSNLLVDAEGNVKLTDFGVAQVFATDRLTVTGGIVGTAEYMSPEQAQGKRANKQSDLYSLGAVMYAMVCGRPPFSGATAVEVLQKHRFGRFDPPRLINPDIPSWLEEIIVQLLEKDPAKRFPDALVLARRLEQVLAKMSLAESPTGTAVGEDSATLIGEEPTLPNQTPGHSGPGPATLMKQLVRAELEDHEQGGLIQRILNSTWFLVSMLVVVIALLASRFQGNQPTTEPIEEEIVSGADAEPRRILAVAREVLKTGNAADAENMLMAAQTLLADDPQNKPLYDQISRLLDRARLQRGSNPQRYAWITEALQRAEQFQKEQKPAQARAIHQAVIDLYDRDPDARELVEKARTGLTLRSTTETPSKPKP